MDLSVGHLCLLAGSAWNRDSTVLKMTGSYSQGMHFSFGRKILKLSFVLARQQVIVGIPWATPNLLDYKIFTSEHLKSSFMWVSRFTLHNGQISEERKLV